MSGSFSDNFNSNNSNDLMGNVNEINPKFGPLGYGNDPSAIYYLKSLVGWNAAIVGLLSCILAILVLLTSLYYLAYRRRYMKNLSECPSPIALVEKSSASPKLVISGSQTAMTTFVNETGKETKVNGHAEQQNGNGDLVGNGHASPSHTNGLLANGNTDQSELRLLQHEDN
ncbi:unnamed protein product [Rotaria magnacalcarata]|uniref:Uncharacterized protein n=2 Tax=Rotaria magnacalcarata TaxID=392030 RepID=A0A819GQA7_9BILA|nr:unnamed protein product [Rotaria magnacalcarata]CAF1354108.1 unnamed protein product [Rotaria magnacalcarata]CAF2011457.1 unnamed protein product [Rotaria magnacalcarata]CAF2093699.1 unnamed protein product [Rotaria magnacalcarata]CAF2132792.1 unnamed protein product [Rotaria magnacalcarata]